MVKIQIDGKYYDGKPGKNLLETCLSFEVFNCCSQHNFGASLNRKTEYACTDCGEGDAPYIMFISQFERVQRRVFEFIIFVAFAHPWANRVDDVFRLEFTTRGDYRSADKCPAYFIALLLNRRPAFSPYRTRDASAENQLYISGVYDCVGIHLGDIAVNKFKNGICNIRLHNMLIDYLWKRELEAKNKGLQISSSRKPREDYKR